VIGRITFYNSAKGYGFLTTFSSPSQELFFHHSHFRNGEIPAIGAYVVFGIAPGIEGKKTQAVGIRFATAHEVAGIEDKFVAGINSLAATKIVDIAGVEVVRTTDGV
jgi:cold shock CspA family protein